MQVVQLSGISAQMHDMLRGILKNDKIFIFILSLLAYRKKNSPSVYSTNITINDFYLDIKEISGGDYIPQDSFVHFSPQQEYVIGRCLEIIDHSSVGIEELSEALLSTHYSRSIWSGCCSPKLICDIIPKLLCPAMHDRIFSPTFGLGQLERSMIQYAIVHSHGFPKIDAIEINSDAVFAGKLFNFINEYSNITITTADMFTHNQQTAHYDIAVCTPPFGARAKQDRYGGWMMHDLGPLYSETKNRESISVEEYSLLKGYFSLNENGRMAIVISNGLFMRNEFQHTLKMLLERDHLEAVIDLSPKIYSYTHIPSTLIIIDKTKNLLKRNKFIYISPDKIVLDIDKVILIP